MTPHARLPGLRQEQRPQAAQAVQQPPWPQAMPPLAPRAQPQPQPQGTTSQPNDQARSSQDPSSPAAGGPSTAPAPAGGPPDNKAAGPVYLAVLAFAAAGLLLAWVSSSGVRVGAVLAGGALVAAALARLVLPARLAGMLAARHRYMDAGTLAVLGFGMIVIGLLLPPPS